MHSHPEEDLAVIRRIMADTRNTVIDRGRHFVIWGTLPVVGLVATYLAVTGRSETNPVWVWMAVLAVGWAASMVIGAREGRSSRVTTLGRRLLTGAWVSVAASLTLLALAGMFGGVIAQAALPGLLSVVIAPPIFLTALLTGERWLHAVAAGWWAGGTIMLFVPGTYTLILMAGMALILLAVPGLVLNSRARGSRSASDPSAVSP